MKNVAETLRLAGNHVIRLRTFLGRIHSFLFSLRVYIYIYIHTIYTHICIYNICNIYVYIYI